MDLKNTALSEKNRKTEKKQMLYVSMFTKLIYSDKGRMVTSPSQGVGSGSKGVRGKSQARSCSVFCSVTPWTPISTNQCILSEVIELCTENEGIWLCVNCMLIKLILK